MTAARFAVNNEDFVVIPLREYEALRRLADAAEDVDEEAHAADVYARHLAQQAAGEALSLPADQWHRIRAGASPLRVIREHRGLTQIQLAERSGIDQPQLSGIENKKRIGTVQTLKALARALNAPMEALVSDDQE